MYLSIHMDLFTIVNCSSQTPYAKDFVRGLSSAAVCVFAGLSLISLLTCVLFAEVCVFLSRNLRSAPLKDRSLLVLGLFPVISICAQLGMAVPRAATLTNLITSVYTVLALLGFFRLTVASLGGEDDMLEKMRAVESSLRVPPCCCCCLCLPRVRIDRSVFTVIRLGISQAVFLLPLLHLTNAVLWADGKYFKETEEAQSPLFFVGVVMTVSTALCLYVFNVLMRTRSALQAADHGCCHLLAKYVILLVTVVISGLQPLVLEQLTAQRLIPCTHDFHWQGRASEFDHMLKVLEAFVLMLVSRRYYRKLYPESTPLSADSSAHKGNSLDATI